MRFSDDWPIAPTLPTTIVITASVANAGAHVVDASISADVEEPQDDRRTPRPWSRPP